MLEPLRRCLRSLSSPFSVRSKLGAATLTVPAFTLGGADGGGCGGDPAGGAVPFEVASPDPSCAGGSGGAEAVPLALLTRCANGDSEALDAVDIGDTGRAGG